MFCTIVSLLLLLSEYSHYSIVFLILVIYSMYLDPCNTTTLQVFSINVIQLEVYTLFHLSIGF
jgi:hypothetical protein